MFYGLSKLEGRKLAYELPQKKSLKYQKSRGRDKSAEIDRLAGFLSRHTLLVVRTPEGCSLS